MMAASLLWTSAAGALAPGDFDPAFGSGGTVFYPWGSGAPASSQIYAVALQPDGKIVLGGYATDANGKHAFLVARLGTDGVPDPSFGDGGKVLVQLGSADQYGEVWSEVHALTIQPDGKVLAGGSASRPDGAGFLVARLTADGGFDSSFGGNGTAELPTRDVPGGPTVPGGVSAIALQPDGKIVTGGGLSFSQDVGAAQVTRLTASGSPDASFGDDGVVLLFRSNTRHGDWDGHAVALQPDGRILLAGVGADPFENPHAAALVVRLTSSGNLDSTFGDDGMVFYQPLSSDDPGREAEANAMVLQPDGKIVLGGYAWNGIGQHHGILVARLSGKDGSLDPSFANGGTLLAQLGSDRLPGAAVQTLALQPNGKIVLGGWANDSDGSHELMVARLAPDGSFDPAFGNGGTVLQQLGSGGSQNNALALQPDANIIAAGTSGSQSMIARLLGEAPPTTPAVIPPGTPSTTGPAPVAIVALSKLRVSPVAFGAADRGGSIARRTGTTVSYVDSQAATTTFTVLKPTRGVKSGGRCLKPSRGRHGRACTRYVTVGRFTHGDSGGQNSFHFSGRVRHHKLAPGRYRLQAIPRFAGRTGHKTTTNFRIVE